MNINLEWGKDWQKLPVLRDDKLLFTDTSGMPKAGAVVPCLLCTKPFMMPQYIGYPDQICPECWETYKDTAKIICWKCRITICRVIPKVLDNGFYIRPRSVLHSSACNICQPGLEISTIIEIDEWQKTMRQPKAIVIPKNIKIK